jgi:thermostable 8-oxoguanine DNA glycosylase
LILDQRVQDSMENYEDFEKIDTGSTNPTVNNYISYLEKINELTNHFGIPEEKIELFLYNQVWKEK